MSDCSTHKSRLSTRGCSNACTLGRQVQRAAFPGSPHASSLPGPSLGAHICSYAVTFLEGGKEREKNSSADLAVAVGRVLGNYSSLLKPGLQACYYCYGSLQC